MAPPALLSDVGDHSDWDVGMNNCRIHVPVNGYAKRMLPEHMKFLLEPPPPCDDDDDGDDDDDDDHCIEKVDDDSGDQFVAYLLYDLYRWEPLGSYLTRQYYEYSAPPYFKRDHPDDDLFLKHLGDSQVPWRSQLKYPKHADELLIKDVVAFIIWQDTKHDIFWEKLRKLSMPDQDDTLYSDIIRGAASLVYFLHTQANLFRIGHDRTLDKQMDKIFTLAQQWAKKGIPIDEVCELLFRLTLDKDDFSFVTENDLAYMICYYAIDFRFKDFKRPPTVKVTFPPTDKDQLFEDITKVVRKVELSSTELKADEYTHWMMTLLREEVSQVEENLISQAIGDNPMLKLKLARPSVGNNPMIRRDRPLSMDDLSTFLLCLFVKAKDRMKQELANVVLPLNELCKLHRCKVCTEICETIQVADLRRMSLGSRFIGRSHLIWAFYKLGYALPLQVREAINVSDFSDSNEVHPPYHIYMAALRLALCSGEKMMQLDHFIFAVLNSKDFDFVDEEWTEFYQDFKDFQKALESMETEVEPKSTVTVRPCGSLNIFSDSSNDSDDSQERTTGFDPSSSENLSTDTGGAEESII